MSIIYLAIYILLLLTFIKYKSLKIYTLFSLFPILLCAIEIYKDPRPMGLQVVISVLLAVIWLSSFCFHGLKTRNIKTQLYWGIWALLIYSTTVLEIHTAIYLVSTGAGILYLIFQSEFDDQIVKVLMLISIAADILYLVFSPDFFSAENYLLVPDEGVVYLEFFLKFLVPVSLGMKIAAYHKSLVGCRRNELLCTTEIFFLSVLLLYKYNSGFLLSKTDWDIVAGFFVFITSLFFVRSILDKSVTFSAVLSLFLLNICIYISLVSFFQFQGEQLMTPLLIILLQRIFFRSRKFYVFGPFLTVVVIPALMLMGMETQNMYLQASLLLAAVSHLLWVFNEKLKAERHYAF